MQAEIACLGDRSCFTEEQAGELLPIFQERLALFDVKRAAAYYLAIRGSFSATVTSFGVKGMDVENLLKLFPPVSARLKDVPLENKNALQLIRERDREDGLIYADPPYVKTERIYRIVYSYTVPIHSSAARKARLWSAKSSGTASPYTRTSPTNHNTNYCDKAVARKGGGLVASPEVNEQYLFGTLSPRQSWISSWTGSMGRP